MVEKVKKSSLLSRIKTNAICIIGISNSKNM